MNILEILKNNSKISFYFILTIFLIILLKLQILDEGDVKSFLLGCPTPTKKAFLPTENKPK